MANKQVANLNKEGMLSLNGVIDERSSPKVGNLIHHIPFDNQEGIDRAKYIPSVNLLNTGVEDKIQESHNLIDAVGFDWRDPSNWENGDSNVVYNEELDCLEITGVKSLYAFSAIPIFHDKKFNISCDVWQVSRSTDTKIYVGGKYYGEDGNVRPSSEHVPGSWDYLSFVGQKLNPSDNWVTGHNKHTSGVPRQGIGTHISKWKNTNGKFYSPLILANYAGTSTDVVRIRNLRIWYSDDKIDNNTEHTGLSTQLFNDTIKNLARPLTNTFDLRHDSSGLSVLNSKLTMPNGNLGLKCVTYGNETGDIHLNTDGHIPVKASTQYTLSFMIRTNNPDKTFVNSNLFYTREYKAGKVVKKVKGIFPRSAYDNAPHMGDGWRYVTLTFTTDTEIETLTLDQYLYRNGLVVEMGNYTLVEGKASLYIPEEKSVSKSTKPLIIRTRSLPSFTIVSKFINSKPMVNDVDGGLHQHALLMTLKSTNGSVHIKNWIDGGKNYRPFLDPDTSKDWNESTTNRHIHIDLNLSAGQLTYLVVKFSSSDKKLSFQFFNDKGNRISGGTMPATANTPLLKEIKLGSTSVPWDVQHLDLKVYNTSLSDEHIKTLISSKVNVDDGIMSEDINEKLNRVDLPLLDLPKRKNEYGQGYQTSHGANNITHSDTSLWNHNNRPNIDRTVMTPYGKGIKFMSGSINGSTSGNNVAYLYDDNAGFTTSDYVCFSAWVYMSKDCDITSARISLEQALSKNTRYDMSKKGQWQFLQVKGKITKDGNLRNLLYLFNKDKTPNFKGYIIYSDITLTKTTASAGSAPTSQFENLALNERSLQINLNRDYKFSWNKDWTIQYWKRPMSSQVANYHGYCIDSIGCNSNSVGGSYLWWGKKTSANTIENASPSAINPDEFWNNWRLITLVHDASANTITIYERNRFTAHKRVISVSITKENQYVTQYGYDLMLGGWDENDICVAEYKDIRVSNIAITETQVNESFTQGMSQKDVLTLNGELIENTL